MKNVLIPVNGSPCSLSGVNLVISKRARYAKPEELEIHLVNVQHPFSHDVGRFVDHDQMLAFHREEGEKCMRPACELLDAAGAKYTCHYMVGNVAEAVTQLANELSCDQIVMGTHGHSAIGELLTGSNTLKIVQLSKIPVTLVK
ncbi:MAG: hypothetical protein RL300_1114 [Pseudomonadota bacterium]|jgi:nucleotide-binding universal stress UspA family protein